MEKYVRSIRVEDVSGTQFEMHEYRSNSFLMPGRRFQLDTGESAELMNDKTFKLVRTGEVLVPI